MDTGQFPPHSDPQTQGNFRQFQASGQPNYPPYYAYQPQFSPVRRRGGFWGWFDTRPIKAQLGMIFCALFLVIILLPLVGAAMVVAGQENSTPSSSPPYMTLGSSPVVTANQDTSTPSPTPTQPTPTPIPTRQPVPTSVVQGVTPDNSGIYYGDSSSSEETRTFYITAPWFILWKCGDTTGSVFFSVDNNQGDVIQIYGAYPCSTTIQKITINYSGLLRIGSIPFDMDGPYYYGAAHP